MAAGKLGRPSRIYDRILEARCEACGDWIHAPAFRLHFESQHPQVEKPRGGEIRETPVPERIVEYVTAGVYLDAAAAAVGVAASTVFGWKAIGEEWEDAAPQDVPPDRQIFVEFSVAIKQARLAAEPRFQRIIERAAAEGDWKAAAWMLERTRPERFSRIEKLRIGGDRDGDPVRVVHEEADPDFISEVMRIYTEQGVVPGVDSGNGKRPARKRVKKEA